MEAEGSPTSLFFVWVYSRFVVVGFVVGVVGSRRGSVTLLFIDVLI